MPQSVHAMGGFVVQGRDAASRQRILDDALASVDAQTEAEILGRLRGIFASRTSILISHRISTIREADQILVLEGGEIPETGDHESLLRRRGLYSRLHELQFDSEDPAL